MGWAKPETIEIQSGTRRGLLLGLVLSAAWVGVGRTGVPRPRPRPRRVLFICRHGTVKSPIARELLRRRAAERGVGVVVQARGLEPEDHVTPALARALAADGINPRSEPTRRYRSTDLAGVDLVVMFDPPPAHGPLSTARDWSDLPSMNADYPRARADLLQRIDRLLDEMMLS